jgi:hypothetical protein
MGNWRRPQATIARGVVALIVTTGVALVLAACGRPSSTGVANVGSTTTLPGSPSSVSSAATQVSQALSYARCVRSKGVTNFPDPNAAGAFNKLTMSQLASGNPTYSAATASCAHLFPSIDGTSAGQAQLQVIANDEAKFVRCMRTHGVSNWPNPVLSQGREVFDPAAVGIKPNAPAMAAKIQACDVVFPASIGVPPGAGHNP